MPISFARDILPTFRAVDIEPMTEDEELADRVVLRTIYEVLMPESSHFNSNQHRGIRVSPRMIVLVNVARASGDGEGSDDRKVGCNMTGAKVSAMVRPYRGA